MKDKEIIFIKVAPSNINYVNRIMEGYEYLGVVTTVNPAEGKLMVRVTSDTYHEVEEILKKLPIWLEFI